MSTIHLIVAIIATLFFGVYFYAVLMHKIIRMRVESFDYFLVTWLALLAMAGWVIAFKAP